MRVVTIILAALIWSVLVPCPAFAQGLPASVTEPYVRYQQAMEAQDFDTARTAADLAWRAAEEADIDIATTGVLADNYAQLAHRAGDYAEADRAYSRSAEILTITGEDPLLIAQTWRLAAQSAFMGNEPRRAESLADQAGDILERLPRTREREVELYRARLIQTYVEWESGQIRSAGRRAVDAVEALEAAGGAANSDTANLFFYAGVRYANERDNLDAAYYFSIANYIWRTLAAEGTAREIAQEWARYARRQLDDDDLATLISRLADSPYRNETVAAEEADADSGEETEGWRARYPDATEYIPARPRVRRPPRYPAQMAMAGMEGVALMQFDVDENGRTENITVLYAVPHPSFGEAGIDAVERWTYEPAYVDGEPMARQGVVTVIEYRMAE